MTASAYRALHRAAVEPGAISEIVVHPEGLQGDHVELQVDLCGLCGSDLHMFSAEPSYDWIKPGTVVGHEIVARVASTGAEVTGWSSGQRVVPLSVYGCGHCSQCVAGNGHRCPDRSWVGLTRPGGLAERLVVPSRTLISVPDDVPDVTAVLTEPAAVAARAVVERGQVVPGQRVVVSGPGAIGVLAGVVAAAAGGIVTLVGTSRDLETRAEVCTSLGLELVDHVVSAADVWIEASGSPRALASGLASVTPGGRLVAVGLYGRPIEVNLDSAIRQEVAILASYSAAPDDYKHALTVLRSRPELGELLVDTYPFERFQDAYAAIGRGARVKAAVAPASP